MARSTPTDIRELILTIVQEQHQKSASGGPPLTQTSVFNTISERLGQPYDTDLNEAVLTQWHDLVRTGYFAWGKNLGNPNAPFFHLTIRGRRALERLSRDPGNPAGYLRHLASVARLSPIANSYVTESVDCFLAGFHKAAAVMIGAAAESIILELRDLTALRLTALNVTAPKGLSAWQVKTVLTTLHGFFDSRRMSFAPKLRDEFEAYWLAFGQQIRATRNDAGHPSSIDPVSEDAVHASLLVFPELARLSTSLATWVDTELQASH
jgi:hypothetical protein